MQCPDCDIHILLCECEVREDEQVSKDADEASLSCLACFFKPCRCESGLDKK